MAVVTLVVMSVGGALAYAAGVAGLPGDVVVGCVSNSAGTLRIVDDASQCRARTEHVVELAGPQVPADVVVDCTQGESLADVLSQAAPHLPVTIGVTGECAGVEISRDHVHLYAATPGASIAGIEVSRARDVRVEQVTIPSGGLLVVADSTIFADQLVVRGGGGVQLADSYGEFRALVLEGSAGPALELGHGSSADVEGATITGSAGDGVAVEGAQLALHDSTVSGSARDGVSISLNGMATIGGTNTLEDNGGAGVVVFAGGSAEVGFGSLIRDNGQAGAIVSGGNLWLYEATVTGNQGPGASSYGQGNLSVDADTVIQGNHGPGVNVAANSVASFSGVLVDGNDGPGVTISDLSSATFASTTQITGNAGPAVVCDGPPAVAMALGEAPTMSGNEVDTVDCPAPQ